MKSFTGEMFLSTTYFNPSFDLKKRAFIVFSQFNYRLDDIAEKSAENPFVFVVFPIEIKTFYCFNSRSSAPNVCVPSRCRSSWVTIWRRLKGLPPKDPLTTRTTFIAYRNSSSYFTTLPNTSTYFKIYIETCLHFAPVWY